MSVHYISALLLVCLEVSGARSLIPSVLLLWFTNLCLCVHDVESAPF